MESIVSYFTDIGINIESLLKLAGLLILGSLLINAISRFIFRKQTILAQSVSSSIAIIFIYVVMVLIMTLVHELHFLITPLPFAKLSAEYITFFSLRQTDHLNAAANLLQMIILAFFVGLIDSWMPKSKHLLKWSFWRIVTVAAGFLIHYLIVWAFHKYLPQNFMIYAPAILLGILLVMLLTGALKVLLGLVLATVNPLIGALYTFFFANVVGKLVTRSVLTTAILSAVLVLLQDFGITDFSLAPEALIAYIPFLLLLIPVWYLSSRL